MLLSTLTVAMLSKVRPDSCVKEQLLTMLGPEKLLEVWFAPGPDDLPVGSKKNGLKAVSVESWKEMLDLVNCKVLSVVESEHVDAYLLSESSMFVFPHKLILKTCGTTTLLLGLHRMLNIAAIEAKFVAHNTGSRRTSRRLLHLTESSIAAKLFVSR